MKGVNNSSKRQTCGRIDETNDDKRERYINSFISLGLMAFSFKLDEFAALQVCFHTVGTFLNFKVNQLELVFYMEVTFFYLKTNWGVN